MRKFFVCMVMTAALAFSGSVFAQEMDVATPGPGEQPDSIMSVGAYIGMGMSLVVGSDKPDDNKPKFAGGFGAYFDFYVLPILALTGGLDFQNKGGRTKDGDVKWRASLFYLDIPLGVKLNIQNFRAAVMVSLNFALAGKYKSDNGETSRSDSIDDWDGIRRFNLSPKLAFGYGIPIGIITLVPGISWSMHLLKDGKEYNGVDAASVHNMLILFTFGAEFGF